MIEETAKWPDGLHYLLDQLSQRDECFAVLLPSQHIRLTLDAIAGESVLAASVGEIATAGEDFAAEFELSDKLNNAVVLKDLAVLFDLQSPIKPILFLRRLARHHPRIVVWPGAIEGQKLVYGHPSSKHRQEWMPENVVLLEPVLRYFPDEMPFNERWIG